VFSLRRNALSPKLLALELIAGLLVLGWVIFILRAAVRTVNLPVCWKCGYAKVRRSHTQIVPLFLLKFLESYRCRGCRAHFYGFQTRRQLAEGDDYDVYSEA
jgi:hypothetical protein